MTPYRGSFALACVLVSSLSACTTSVTSGGGTPTPVPTADPLLCGNDTLDPGEPCDGGKLDGAACTDTPGFVGGTLACTSDCSLDFAGCEAVPSDVHITSVNSATLVHEQVHTILGDGFGVKNPVAPLSFDDFEGGTLGHRLGDAKLGLGWSHQTYSADTGNCNGDPCTYYDDEEVFAGSQSATNVNDVSSLNFFGWVAGGNFLELYVHYWRNFKPFYADLHNICNHKQIYIYNSIADNPQWLLGAVLNEGDGWPISPQGTCVDATFTDANGFNRSTSVVYPEASFISANQNRWQRWEIFLRNDSPASAHNGAEYFWLDGKLLEGEIAYSRPDYSHPNVTVTDRETLNLIEDDCATQNVFMQDFRLGAMVHNDDPCSSRGPAGEPDWTYLDDVYIDSTRARIEVCDVPTWTQKESEGALCAIQIPAQVWTDGEARFIANRGGLLSGSVYLYVVNGAGQVNQAGYPVAIQ